MDFIYGSIWKHSNLRVEYEVQIVGTVQKQEIEVKLSLSSLSHDIWYGRFFVVVDPWVSFHSLCLFSCLDDTLELKMWTESMSEDPAVKATGHSVDTYKGFYKTYTEGKPNYDYGL